MSGLVVSVLISTGLAYLLLASFLCLVAAADIGFPREEPMAWENRKRAILFSAIFIPCAIVSGKAVGLLLQSLGLFALADIPGLLGFFAAIFLTDFLYYWYHRAQHSVPWMWRFHATHHAVEKMGAGAGYHHLAEAPLKALFVSLPVAVVMDSFGGPLIAFLYAIHGFYIHSTTRIGFGRLAWVVADNRVHRIHHSLEPKHFDKNFGALTLLWDKLFGTAYFPKRGEWPDIGLEGQPEASSVREWLTGIDPNSAARDVAARM